MGRAVGAETVELPAAGTAAVFTCTLYRSGSLTKEPYREQDLQSVSLLCDSFKPDSRPGRTDGLFCSYDIRGLARWYAANLSCRLPSDPRAISYRGPEPWIYPIALWEKASSWKRPELFAEWWQAGVPLSTALAEPEAHPASEWEILIDERYVRGARTVSKQRIIAAADEHTARQLMQLLYPRRLARGLRTPPSR